MRRMDPKVDGQIRNSLVGTCHAIRFILNLLSNFCKTHKFLALGMKKLSIFGGSIDQLENQGTPGHNTVSTRQKIPEKEKIQTSIISSKMAEELFSPRLLLSRPASQKGLLFPRGLLIPRLLTHRLLFPVAPSSSKFNPKDTEKTSTFDVFSLCFLSET